ncbi:uncharacterized protein [Diadema antillarum]
MDLYKEAPTMIKMTQRYTLKPQPRQKRLPRYKFEASDRTLLQNLVNKYIGIVEQKAVNQNMLDEKNRAWRIITQKFNTQSVDKRIRNAKQLRKCWENMKWRARREAKEAGFDVDVPQPVTVGNTRRPLLIGSGDFVDEHDEGDDIYNEEVEYDDEEEEVVAPMGTEPIVIDDAASSSSRASGSFRRPPREPHPPDGYHVNHPPDDELIGSFVADAWMAEDPPGENDDREGLHMKADMLEAVRPVEQESHMTLWNGASTSSPARSPGGTSSLHTTRTPPPASDVTLTATQRAPSVSSSVGDAAESISSRLSASSAFRKSNKPREGVNQNRAHRRASPVAPLTAVDVDAISIRSQIEEARQLRDEEEHTKRMELIQAQLDYEKSKVARMQRLMEMSELEHRARMRMLARYQQVAEKQKDYWSRHADGGDIFINGAPPNDQVLL